MTPAINVLKRDKIKYKIHKYEHDPANTNFGDEAVDKLGLDPNRVFKTLLAQIAPKKFVVCVIPVSKMLNLKDLALNYNVKKATMADKNMAQKVTGYLLGGISPLGQKKRLETSIDISAFDYETIYVSGGKRGLDIELSPIDLKRLLNAKTIKISV